MPDALTINGYHLYHSFLSGYEYLLKERKHLNDINVFPVADGDTGSNMVATMYSTLQLPRVSRSAAKTLSYLADRSLSAARGNSGIILAQFINGLAKECPKSDTITAPELGDALVRAAEGTRSALEDPREGTLLTVMSAWSSEFSRLVKAGGDLKEHFAQSLAAAQKALENTKNQLDVLKKANVVDAGASGFVSFIEGVTRMLLTGRVSWQRKPFTVGFEDTASAEHDLPETSGEIPFRYCTEALLLNPDGTDLTSLRKELAPFGDSLIITGGRDKVKIHIHTNEPARLFAGLGPHGRIIEQKIDDMVHQYNAVHHPVAKIAIVTDSIADIPQELIDRLQIHVIPLKILWGQDEYLDRLSIDTKTFYPWLDSREEFPSSSIPDPVRVEQVFSWLSTHYESVIAIPVGRVLSGTWQVMKNAAAKAQTPTCSFTVVDSKLNSAAQGLVVLAAAEDAATGMSHDDIVTRTEERIKGSRILVSVATFKYMVRGGRISAVKGAIAALTHLKPIISLDSDGKGVAFGASFSQGGSLKKISSAISKEKGHLGRYAVVHAASPERAEKWAKALEQELGRPCEYIMEISPIVGIHAGVGALAVAWI